MGAPAANVISDSVRRLSNAVKNVLDKLGLDSVIRNTTKSASRAIKVGMAIVQAIATDPRLLIMPGSIAIGTITSGILMGPILGALGFSSIGPVAGSVAADWQSAGGGVLFSTLQSAAMGGYGVASTLISFLGVGAAVGGATGNVFRSDPEDADDGKIDDQSDDDSYWSGDENFPCGRP